MLEVRNLRSKSMTGKCHNRRLQINMRHHEKQTQNTASHITIKVKQLVTLFDDEAMLYRDLRLASLWCQRRNPPLIVKNLRTYKF